MHQFWSEKEDSLSIIEALVRFRNYIEEAVIPTLDVQGVQPFEELERIVPRQQVAPVQFDIVSSRIVVVTPSPKSAEEDKSNIQSALEHIRGGGEQLISNLENSNCDKRLLDSVKELQSQLVSDGNIVKIGLTNMACGVMSTQFQSELPDAVVAMFTSYSASVSLYVAQFPEWEKFTQKAAAIALDDDDIAEVRVAADEIIEVLTDHPALADPEVPRTIAFVRELMMSPGVSSKRAAFAMSRTIENLVSGILRHSVDFFTKTAERTVEMGATAASKVIIGLLGIALVGASEIGPAAVRAGAPWVKQAAEIVQKQIDKMVE